MDKIELQAKITTWMVDVNLNGRDWQLFTTDSEAACNAAAKSINNGIKALALQGISDYASYRKLLVPFTHLGACDTEPECVLEEVLHKLGILPQDQGRFS